MCSSSQDSVSEIQTFTDDAAIVRQALQLDIKNEGNLAALYEAIAAGLTGLADRDVPIRLLLPATYGLENASKTYTRRDVLYALAMHSRATSEYRLSFCAPCLPISPF